MNNHDLNQVGGGGLTTLKYFCINRGDQKVFLNAKASLMS